MKKILRIMIGAHTTTPCRSLFKKLEILPIPYRYIFSLMNSTVENQENLQTNSSVHSFETRNKDNFHRLIASYAVFRRVNSILVLEYSTIYHVGSQILSLGNQTLK
jgi:hypothetical protein